MYAEAPWPWQSPIFCAEYDEKKQHKEAPCSLRTDACDGKPFQPNITVYRGNIWSLSNSSWKGQCGSCGLIQNHVRRIEAV